MLGIFARKDKRPPAKLNCHEFEANSTRIHIPRFQKLHGQHNLPKTRMTQASAQDPCATKPSRSTSGRNNCHGYLLYREEIYCAHKRYCKTHTVPSTYTGDFSRKRRGSFNRSGFNALQTSRRHSANLSSEVAPQSNGGFEDFRFLLCEMSSELISFSKYLQPHHECSRVQQQTAHISDEMIGIDQSSTDPLLPSANDKT